MNLSNPWQPNLPQIVPKPNFPVPKISNLAHNLSYAVFHHLQSTRGSDQIKAVYKTNSWGSTWGSVWSVQKTVVAIYLAPLKDAHVDPNCYLFLTEPEESKFISRKILFDRFNSLLRRGALPTLHQVVKDYWIFADGVPWTGRRTLCLTAKKSGGLSEKEILNQILRLRPGESKF